MYRFKQEPIPPFETGAALLARLAPMLRPKKSLTVSEWAERYMPHYDPAALPFLAEIMDALSDPETSEVGDMGPAQAGKSLVGEAFIGWSIEHDPADFLVCQPDKALMQDFVVRRINPLIGNVPVLKQQLLPMASADNIFLKQFRGMLLTSIWPVGSQFRARPVPRGWLDDYDQFPEDIDGQGDAISLLDGRQTTFEGRDTKLVSSSPAHDSGGGIEAFVASGTDEQLRPKCPHCDERIELDLIKHLKFERGSAEIAEQSAHAVCEANGCILLPGDRHTLLASCAELPNRGFVATHPERGKRRRTFRRSGLLSLRSWGALARQWYEAEEAWESRQDEGPRRTFWNVRAAKNYRSALSGDEPVKSDDLKSRREAGWMRGTIRDPAVKVVTISVDVQHDRFECALIGHGKDRETWLIDRFPVDVLDDGLTQVAPFVHKEHWKALLPLFDRKVPLVDNGGAVVGHAPVLCMVVDTGGSDKKGDQATEGARWFWQAALALGVHPSRVTLMKGGSRPTGPLMPAGKFADQKVKGGARRNSARLWIPNVHMIKNMIDARLRRTSPGPGYIHFPGDLPDEYFDELTAEHLVNGKWDKQRNRNETWDNIVQGEVALLKPPFAQSRTDTRWVPKAYRVTWPDGAAAVPAAPQPLQGADAEPVDAPVKKTKAAPRRRKGPRSRGWMDRLR